MEQWALLLLLGVVAAAVVQLLQWRLSSHSRKLKLPPGPRPLPVFGNLFLFITSKLWHKDFYKLADKYGPIMWVRLGSQGAVVVQSPELAMEFLKHQDSIFASRPPPSYTVGLVTNNCKDLGFAPLGSYWRFIRKLMTTELFTHKRINDFQHVRVEEVGRLVEAIRRHIGKPVDLGYLLANLNLNNITRMGMSRAAVSSYEVEDPQQQGTGGSPHSSVGKVGKDFVEDKELVHLVRGVITMLGVQGIGDAVPWLSFLDSFLLPKAQYQQTMRQMNNFLAGIIQEHRQYQKANPGCKPRDFLDVLLSVPSSDGEAVTDDIIKSQLIDTMNAGTDTSSTTTEWAMAELLRQPEALEQAVRELEQVVGQGRDVAESDIPDLPYLQAVVKETLRMHPPVPFLIPHYSTESTTVGGYHVPAHTTVLVNTWALGQDPAYWEQPHQFRPQRFLQDRSEPDVRGHHFQLLPFGAGRRMCPGMELGLTVVHLTLAALLHSFSWSLPPDVKRPQDLDMSEHQGITVRKALSLKAVPAVRI